MTTLHYESYGDGERVYVGIPGFGAPHEKSFGLMLERLPQGVKFYGIDPPGIGKSPDVDDWSWDGVNALILEAINAIAEEEGKKVTLVGACSGSFHVMEAARLDESGVEQVYLIEPFAYFPWYVGLFVAPVLGPTLLYSLFGSPVGRKGFQACLTAAGLTGGYDTMASFAKVHWRHLYNYLSMYNDAGRRQVDGRRGAEVFGTISVPKRIYSGAKTVGAIKESLPRWEEIFDEVEITVLDGVGHQVTQEDPDRITNLVFDDIIAANAARAEAELASAE